MKQYIWAPLAPAVTITLPSVVCTEPEVWARLGAPAARAQVKPPRLASVISGSMAASGRSRA